jgi:GNAT superfamily N-acetyltransferase
MKLHNYRYLTIEYKLRKAVESDKSKVLAFCSNTFRWGDYIHEVWDTWYSNPNGLLLVAEIISDDIYPGDTKFVEVADPFKLKNLTSVARRVVGLSHVCVCPTKKQIWLEGIRVDPRYRRIGIASELISRMIEYGKKIDSSIREAAAITAETNNASKCMLEKNGFKERAQWAYYTGYKENGFHTNREGLTVRKDIFKKHRGNVPVTADPTSIRRDFDVSFASKRDTDEIITFLSSSKTFNSSGRRIVQSWKWYELDLESPKIMELIARKKIIMVRTHDYRKIEGLAITNNHIYANSLGNQIQRGDGGRKEIIREEYESGYNVDDVTLFQLVYLDAPTSDSLENLLIFIAHRVMSSGKFDRIQLFIPNQVHNKGSDFYEIADVLAKFGISKSERFSLYIRSL